MALFVLYYRVPSRLSGHRLRLDEYSPSNAPNDSKRRSHRASLDTSVANPTQIWDPLARENGLASDRLLPPKSDRNAGCAASLICKSYNHQSDAQKELTNEPYAVTSVHLGPCRSAALTPILGIS